MTSPVLVEYDMRIMKGEQEEDDLQLVDGAADYCNLTMPCTPFTNRIHGDCGAVDITLALVVNAVEATIDVIVSEVRSGFNLSLGSYVLGGGSYQGIELLRDIIGDSCVITRRYVIAVQMGSWMHLKFKVGQNSCKNDFDHHCSFKAKKHGYDYQQIMLELASISVKVTWSTLRTRLIVGLE